MSYYNNLQQFNPMMMGGMDGGNTSNQLMGNSMNINPYAISTLRQLQQLQQHGAVHPNMVHPNMVRIDLIIDQ